jgi:predicted RNA methylase
MNDLAAKKEEWRKSIAEVELQQLKDLITKKGFIGPYNAAKKNSWIVITLRDKKQRFRFNECETLILVGSGMYPYSMFDVHKQYPHIKQIGIEIDPKRAEISKKLISASPAKDSIHIETCDGVDYDYSNLKDSDLVFISADVEYKEIMNKIIQTSKAHINICAPQDTYWLKGVISQFS